MIKVTKAIVVKLLSISAGIYVIDELYNSISLTQSVGIDLLPLCMKIFLFSVNGWLVMSKRTFSQLVS